MKKFYLTTPIYYPNARPHVGSAYTTIVCDVIARYRRMCGDDVAFLTGTDEHGEKIQRAAVAEGKSPGEFVASKRELFKELWRFLNIGDYKFVHTSQNPDHVRSVQWMLRQADEHGYIEKKKYEGRYCVDDERYISDSAEPANCDICGRPAELISEQNYFFKLSAFEKPLLQLYDKHPEFVRPEFRLNEVKSFVKSGLRDISVSRKRIKWGIPWPDDPEQVFYVWYDALTSYMTGIGFGSDDPALKAEFEKYWPADLHMIGKDILRFHAVYWPAFLMAADLPLPKTVFAHGWIYYDQDKMSKSKGNVVYPEPIIETFDSFGAPGNDALRYYLLREAPFGQDTSFSYDGLIQRYNSDLANGLGNLTSRTLAMIGQYFGGKIPQKPGTWQDARDSEIDTLKQDVFQEAYRHYDRFEFSRALDAIWRLIADVDKYLVQYQPWALAKDRTKYERLETVLFTAYDAVRVATFLTHPVLPHSTQRLWEQLGRSGNVGKQVFDDLAWQVPGPVQIGNPGPIFPRLDKEATLVKLHELAEVDLERDKPKEALKPVEKESAKAPEPRSSTGFQPVKEDTARMAVPRTPSTQSPAPSPSQITIEDFAKVDMRVGEVVSAERVPGAQKLLKMMVDIGTEVRQVVAGIAEYYTAEQLVGMKVVLVVNLAPRKLRGVESNGMVVAATVGDEGRPVLCTFKEEVSKGARLK